MGPGSGLRPGPNPHLGASHSLNLSVTLNAKVAEIKKSLAQGDKD
jgi:hypothetical protein